jgi:chain length determinant protein EpsF
MTLQQFLYILWARRKLVAYVLFSTIGLALIVSLVMPKQYKATTAVVVDVKSPDPIAGIVLPGLTAPGYMATQVDIIQSDRVAQRVVKLLKLDADPAVKEKWQEATDGKGSLQSWLADLLQRKLDVKPSRESNVIEIDFSGSNAEFAAVAANAFAQAYIDTVIELRVEPARQYANWFDEQLKAQRERLEVAQKTLSDYQQKNGIVATDERLDYETQKLNDLSTQLTQTQAQGADLSSKQKSGSSDTLPEVIQSPLINDLKSQIAKLESKLKELSGNLGVNHPQYKNSAAELAELRARLRSETNLIANSINSAGRVSHTKEGEILAAIEAQKTKLLELRKQRDEISVLLRDVDSAQKSFDAVSQRMTQTKMESQSVQTNVSILNPAVEPLKPSKPRVLINMLVAAFLGTLMGISFALMAELSQRRIRSLDDMIQVLDLPLLVELDSALPVIRRGAMSWFESLMSIFNSRKKAIAGGGLS